MKETSKTSDVLIYCTNDLTVLAANGNHIYAIRDKEDSAEKFELKIPLQKETKKGDQGDVEPSELSCEVTSLHTSACQTYILATTSDKRLIVWKRSLKDSVDSSDPGEKWVIHSIRKTPRKCIQVLITDGASTTVLVADRAGDVYEYQLEAVSEEPKLLMGRLSMLLDMCLTFDGKMLIVCDRDEKIQVSHYPECFDIVSFCLGHRQFVTSIKLIGERQLVSVGGDGQVKLWDVTTGSCLSSFDCWKAAGKVPELQPFDQFRSVKDEKQNLPPLKKVLVQDNFVIAVYSRVPYVHVMVCDGTTLTDCGGILTEKPIWDASTDGCSNLWILTPLSAVYKLEKSGTHALVSGTQSVQRIVDDVLQPLTGISQTDNQLDILYKQWFDNVEEYLERKKQREEEKHKKSRNK